MSPKVFYNNSCSICRFEINHYKKITKNIDWIDISNEKSSLRQTKIVPKFHIRPKKYDKLLVFLSNLLKTYTLEFLTTVG